MRALRLLSAGSLPDRIEMKTMLSMPSTISSSVRVSRRDPDLGVGIQSMGRQATAARSVEPGTRRSGQNGLVRQSGPERDGGDVAGIRVSGRGEVAGPPDMLTIATRVSVSRPSVADAVGDAASAATRLRQAAAGAGVATADVFTTGYAPRAGARPGRPPSHHRLPRRALGDRGGA